MRSDLAIQSQQNARSIGFPRSESPTTASSAGPQPATQSLANKPKPSQKSPKGRWFVSLVLLSLIGFVAVSLWNEFVHFQAYGELKGSVVQLSSESPGTILAIHVTEGDLVHAGQLLAELDLRQLRREQRRLNRELEVALSNLQVRLAEVNTRNRELKAEHIDRRVRHFQLLGEYHENDVRLKSLSDSYQRNLLLRDKDAVSKAELMDSKAAYDGLKAQHEDLAAAIAAFDNPNSEIYDPFLSDELLESETTRIASLRSELSELDGLVNQSQIRSPVAGRVLKRFAQPGEQLRTSDPILELVETGSVEAVVYMPQSRAHVLAIGDQLQVVVKPLEKRQVFRVTRISPEVVPPPETLKANYRAFRGLVRVHCEQVDARTQTDLTSWVGAELALPRFGYRMQNSPAEGDYAMQNTAATSHGRD